MNGWETLQLGYIAPLLMELGFRTDGGLLAKIPPLAGQPLEPRNYARAMKAMRGGGDADWLRQLPEQKPEDLELSEGLDSAPDGAFLPWVRPQVSYGDFNFSQEAKSEFFQFEARIGYGIRIECFRPPTPIGTCYSVQPHANRPLNYCSSEPCEVTCPECLRYLGMGPGVSETPLEPLQQT